MKIIKLYYFSYVFASDILEKRGGDHLTGNKKIYRKLFSSTFQLSACTFGGGFVIIPLMRKKFVEELHWIEEEEMMDFTAIAQSSPGAIAVNASILVGYHVAGAAGALVTVLGTVLPPLLIISVISFFYRAFRDNALVNMAMTGMLAGVAAVICDVVLSMGKELLKKKRVLWAVILLASFGAVYFLQVNIILIILVCGAVGALDTLRQERRGGKGHEIS
ncbi:MAG: chromate transporter [Lachnospiraceae bacterium]|nr:chromate transporter [Lachnospiraceae bacterium]